MNEDKSSCLGRTSHLATGVDAAKSLSVTQCCHLLGELGLCTVTSASAKPMMIQNVVITNGQLLSVLDRGDGALDQHQPKQKCLLTSRVLSATLKYSTRPETQTQDVRYNFGQIPW